MGSIFSKKKKPDEQVKAENRLVDSAPARLEGLEGVAPSNTPRPYTPDVTKLKTELLEPDSPLVDRTKKNQFQTLNEAKSEPTPVLRATRSFDARVPVPKSHEEPLHVKKEEKLFVSVIEPPLNPIIEEKQEEVPVSPVKVQNYDDIPVGPRKGPKKIDVIGAQTDGKKLAAALPAAVTIPDEAKAYVDVFDETTIRRLYSADWKDREHSLSTITRHLSDSRWLASKDASVVYKTTADILARSLRDKVAPLYFASLDLVNLLVSAFASTVKTAELHAGTDILVPVILHRCGNTSGRIHEASLQALLTLTSQSNYGTAYMGPFALATLPKKTSGSSQAAHMVGRLELIGQLLVSFRSTQGMAVEDVLAFTQPTLEMPDDKVRHAAIKVIAELYRLKKMAGDDLEAEKHLGPIKPALMQVILRRFEEVAEEVRQGVNGAPGQLGAGSAGMGEGGGIKVLGKALPPLATTNSTGSSLPPLTSGRTPALPPGLSGPRSRSPLIRKPFTPPSPKPMESPKGKELPARKGTPPRPNSVIDESVQSPFFVDDRATPMPISVSSSLRGGSPSKPRRTPTALSSVNNSYRDMKPQVLDRTEEELLDYIEKSLHK